MSARPMNSPIMFELCESEDERNSIEIPLDRINSEISNHCDNHSQSDVTLTSNKSIILELERPQSWVCKTPPAEETDDGLTQSIFKPQCYPALEYSASTFQPEKNNPTVGDSQIDFTTAPAFILGLESQLFPSEELTQLQFQPQLHSAESFAQSQISTTVKGLKRRYKQQTQSGRRRPVSFRCKLNGGWCLIEQKSVEVLDIIGVSLSGITEKVNTSSNPNVRKLKLHLKEVEIMLKLLGDDHLEHTLPEELWSDMIHNSWDIFHETEKLLNSSPNYLVSNPPNGNISTLRMNKTQEFPSETCSAVESQDFARNRRCQTTKIPHTYDAVKSAELRSEKRTYRKDNNSKNPSSSQQSLTKIASDDNRGFDFINASTGNNISGIENERNIQSQPDYSVQLKGSVHVSEMGRIDLTAVDAASCNEFNIACNAEINEVDNNLKLTDSPSLLVESTQRPAFTTQTDTQTGSATADQIVNGDFQEPHIIYETQICHPSSQNVATEQARELDLLWKKSRLTLYKFSLRPFINRKILSAGKKIILKLNGSNYSGTLISNGTIQTDGFVFNCIGKWIHSISNGQYFTQLSKETKKTFHVEYDGKCLSELIGSELVNVVPEKTSSSIKKSSTQMNSICEQQLIAENRCDEDSRASKSSDELLSKQPNQMLAIQAPIGNKAPETIQTISTCENLPITGNRSYQPLDQLIRNGPSSLCKSFINQPSELLTKETENRNKKWDIIQVKSTCEHQLTTDNRLNKENKIPTFHRGWRNSQLSEEVNYNLLPLDEMRNITRILLHPPSEWFRTCQCLEDFWKTGRVPICVMNDFIWD